MIMQLRRWLPKLKELCGKLTAYCRDVLAETARFSKDAEVLKGIEATTRQRVDLISQWLAVLEAW
jgi:hypothetical protein